MNIKIVHLELIKMMLKSYHGELRLLFNENIGLIGSKAFYLNPHVSTNIKSLALILVTNDIRLVLPFHVKESLTLSHLGLECRECLFSTCKLAIRG